MNILFFYHTKNSENALETSNLAFFGTLAKEGSGKAVVIRIG